MTARSEAVESIHAGTIPVAADDAVRSMIQMIVAGRTYAGDGMSGARATVDGIHPFAADWLDASEANIATVEQHALMGSDLALNAFLTLAAHLPDFVSRSQHALYVNASRGSVLALTVLAERAISGLGFAEPDVEDSIYFEYLAWATGEWNSDADDASFRPTIADSWSPEACVNAVARAEYTAGQSEVFGSRQRGRAARCGARLARGG